MPKTKNVKKVVVEKVENNDEVPMAKHAKILSRQDLLEVEFLRVKAEERTRFAQKCHLEAEKIEINGVLAIKAQRQEALAAEKKAEEYRQEQARLFSKLGKKYDVDFKKSTYDDETGIITVVEDDKKKEK